MQRFSPEGCSTDEGLARYLARYRAPDGRFVLHSDAQAEIDRLAAEREAMAVYKDMLKQAEDDLTKVRAERDAIAAAAFEAAATAQLNGMDLVSRMAREAIRALTPAEAKATLDRMLREAKAEGMREAAEVCDRQAETFSTDEYAVGQPLSSFSERFACAQVKTAILSRAKDMEAEPRAAAQEKGVG